MGCYSCRWYWDHAQIALMQSLHYPSAGCRSNKAQGACHARCSDAMLQIELLPWCWQSFIRAYILQQCLGDVFMRLRVRCPASGQRRGGICVAARLGADTTQWAQAGPRQADLQSGGPGNARVRSACREGLLLPAAPRVRPHRRRCVAPASEFTVLSCGAPDYWIVSSCPIFLQSAGPQHT